jgi:hypothetical protein
MSRSSGTSLAPLKPAWILSSVKALLYTILNANRKSFLVIYVIQLHAKAEILSLYACFNGEKQATLRGYSRCDECRGIQSNNLLFLELTY